MTTRTTGPTVLWMRHGTCDDGLHQPPAHAHPDSPLTQLGRVQVAHTARWLTAVGWKPAVIACSPLRRATASAHVLATELGGCPILSPDTLFTEWSTPECVRGKTPAQYPPEYHTWRHLRKTDPTSALPGGESLTELFQRAAQARAHAHDLTARHQRVLIVSHKLLIGTVAALTDHITNPVHAFECARKFPLQPATTWGES
jgi:broad specificity phosphatase PhoE